MIDFSDVISDKDLIVLANDVITIEEEFGIDAAGHFLLGFAAGKFEEPEKRQDFINYIHQRTLEVMGVAQKQFKK